MIHSGTTRRVALVTVMAGSIVGLAACSSDDGPTPTPASVVEPVTTPLPGAQPTEPLATAAGPARASTQPNPTAGQPDPTGGEPDSTGGLVAINGPADVDMTTPPADATP